MPYHRVLQKVAWFLGPSSVPKRWQLMRDDYNFSSFIASIYPASPAVLNFSINGVLLGNSFTASPTVGEWDQFFATWNSGANILATISLVDQNTAASGNDFDLDLISLSTDPSGGTSVTPGVPEAST